jgi:crotonobetainyl-CoA:carnitine CoA-transferase CaiB-like acyl-CoA transferase
MSSGMVLEGLKIIDAGTMVAGPFGGTLLADLGADVIKLEKPGIGDPMREWAPMKDGKSLWWKVTARNKRLVTLDLSKETGRALFLRLVETADAVIENFRPGTLERWQLSYEDLAKVNPRIILVRVSGYGQTGPYSGYPGYGTVAEGISGIPSFTGFPDRPPTLSAFPLADSLAAIFGVVGLLSAVYERDVTGSGRGQEIDVSLYEPLFRLAESQVVGFDQLGLVKERRGNRLEEDSPRNAYETSDPGEWITISASSDRTFARLASAIGRPDLAESELYSTNASRIANDASLDEIIADWIKKRPVKEVLRVFAEFDVIAGRIYTVRDIFEDPHYQARGDIVEVLDSDCGLLKMPAVFPRFSRGDGKVRWSGGALGSHNAEVYGGVLGLTPDEVAAAGAEGAI